MSKNKILKNIKVINLPNKSNIKPRNYIGINTFNNTSFLGNAKKFDIYKLKKMRPEYKQLYEDLITKKVDSIFEIKKKNVQKPVKQKDKLNYKLNSFLDISAVNKDSQIIFQLNKLKFKILKNKSHSYFSVNKDMDKKIEDFKMKDLEDNSFLAYNNFKKYPKNKFQKDVNINNNNYINNTNINDIKPILNKYLNYGYENGININDDEKVDSSPKKDEKKEQTLITENNKLKKELEYSNNQLEKYKKYQSLYLNLLRKVKTNKHLFKNVNLNDEKNIKEQYVNELIDRRNEINTLLKEDDILENNLKDLLYKLE